MRCVSYLGQYGRAHRADQIPPAGFWAAATHAHPGDLAALGTAARVYGLYRDAAQLHKNATARGDARAARALVDCLHALDPADHRPARWAAAHVALDDPAAVAQLVVGLRKAGAEEQAAPLAEWTAAHVALDDPVAVAALLYLLRVAGSEEQVAALAERLPAAGLFDLFLKIDDHERRFRFGREPDKAAAAPWSWEDLE